ncbi:EF-hand domain-containing protein [Streptomyces sp. NBC_00669]|uniref:EF-hand domain-containing protein n=1 Tax=Streptomyces sp. NBC_00669 TaxID=2976011 RepID=UPI002E3669DB|nr:EF-hand domain-containing protein [Streptomyces sp. NBC_00669]
MRTEAVNRVKLVFTLFDADGNGYLEPDDFDLMNRRVAEAATASDDAARAAMASALQRYWTTLVTELDANQDGRISYEEFQACVLAPERFDDAIADFAHALAALGDPDGDGLIERPLFVALMTAIGFRLPNIHALFDAFAPDAADRVAVPVWVEAIKDYYHPLKGGIPADHLVGAPAV